MICLTGDIHHDSLRTNDQFFLHGKNTEIGISKEYLKILEKYEIKATFFTTGLTLKEQWNDFREVAESSLIELGGHTYSGLPRKGERFCSQNGQPSCSHSKSHGSYEEQSQDVKNMVRIIDNRIGKKPLSWRSHGLVRDENTDKILSENGIKYISDEYNFNKVLPEKKETGLISIPINVLMDHDHLLHAHRTPEFVKKQRENWPFKGSPTDKSFKIERWGNIVMAQIKAIDEMEGLATVLIHPVCMFIADGFKTVEKIFSFMKSLNTTFVWTSETKEYPIQNN
jgi:peptidoglycan/xylan/chitin deacetylase (PgdA/CDA1 family)